MKRKKIFLSYCWDDEEYANAIDHYFEQVGVKLIRDKRDLNYGDSISKFANKSRSSSFSIFLISNEFLKRENCMYEVVTFMKDLNFEKKICPVVINYDLRIVDCSSSGSNNYMKYWKKQYDDVKSIIAEQVSDYGMKEHYERVEKIDEIMRYLPKLLNYLKDRIYILNSSLDKEGFHALSNTLFVRMGISPKINIDTLFKITETDSIESAEFALADYLKNHLISENEYYFYTRANVYEKFGYYELALYNHKMAISTNSKFILSYEAILRMYLKEQLKFDEIYFSIIIDELNKCDNGNNVVLSAKGLLLFKEGRFLEAISIFKKAVCNDENRIKQFDFNSLGNCYEKLYEQSENKDDFMNAESYYLNAIELDVNYYQTYNNLAVLYLKENLLDEAKKKLDICLNIKPEYAHAHNTAGLIYDCENKYDEAILSYSKAYQYNSSFISPLNNIGTNLEYIYDDKLCGIYYKLAYDSNPDSLIYNFNYGNYFRKYTDDTNQALKYLTFALAKAPNNILCNMALGLLYLNKSSYVESRDYFSVVVMNSAAYDPGIFCLLLSDLFIEYRSNMIMDKIASLKTKYPPLIKLYQLLKSEKKIQLSIVSALIEEVEHTYTKTPIQITKLNFINPLFKPDEAYNYIIDNFYNLN